MKKVIKEVIVSEKSNRLLSSTNTYVLSVSPDCNKIELKQYLKKNYDLDPKSVNILNRKPKMRRRGRITGKTKSRRLAYVTLKEGQSFDLVKGLF